MIIKRISILFKKIFSVFFLVLSCFYGQSNLEFQAVSLIFCLLFKFPEKIERILKNFEKFSQIFQKPKEIVDLLGTLECSVSIGPEEEERMCFRYSIKSAIDRRESAEEANKNQNPSINCPGTFLYSSKRTQKG